MPTSYYQTTEDYLTLLIASMQASGSRITDFHEGSVARSVFESLGSVLSYQSLVLDKLAQAFYLSTATGDDLDTKGADYNVPRIPAVQANGVITATRADGNTDSIFIPSGTQFTTRPAPGVEAQTIATTATGTLAASDTSTTMPAQAVLGGSAGNLGSGTVVIPSSPILGIESDGGFIVSTTFASGEDVESDDDYRQRIRTAVQGAANGQDASYLAAALGIPGVQSAAVLGAGDVRSDSSTVPADTVEVYYEGSVTMLAAVTQAVQNRSVTNAGVSAFLADSVNFTVGATIICLDGSDTDTIAANVIAAAVAYVNSIGVGQTVYYSQLIEAIRAVPGVVSVNVPLADCRKSSESSGTAHDVALASDSYALLLASDVTVAVVTI